ncbi:hypothetical protein [Rhodococcus sp. 15-649-2-2]|uniref:hypothetical protein n=1 Tax=Rhodococcus sp. 15-649-2-2 TaxID=2023140 RepID=UPI00211ADA5B|nr:hypothetical protein [Rhodococcus sp. 15-649-2-2]
MPPRTRCSSFEKKVKTGRTSKKAYHLAASADPLGIRVEGISALHGKGIHQLVRNQGLDAH